jgi:uncharacterized protein (TIGR00299 family) protein
MPVPAPATAELLKGVPLATSNVKAELTTPTGAAILTSVVHGWSESPAMTVERIGYGAGKRDFHEQPNLLRLFVGTDRQSSSGDQIWMLETNLDDLPGEVIGYCYDALFAAGALDVFTTPIFMKKSRPGVLLSVMATEDKRAAIEAILFRETTTLGIRRYLVSRDKLERRPHTVSTPWGPVEGKICWGEQKEAAFAPEYESCARIARDQQVALREVYFQAERAFAERGLSPDAPLTGQG